MAAAHKSGIFYMSGAKLSRLLWMIRVEVALIALGRKKPAIEKMPG
jgi:hypothetical protein